MKISIVTVTKNNKAGLLRAIDCVRNQTYKNIEHIIVDGDSTDGTKEIMDEGRWMMENVIFISEADSGIYDAINKGIKLATGDVFGLLHSDDLYADENVIEKYASAFDQPTTNLPTGQAGNQLKTIQAVYSDLVYVKMKREVRSEPPKASLANGGKLEESDEKTTYHQLPTTYSVIRYWRTQKEEFTTEEQRHRELRKGWMPPHPTLFIRKEVFNKYGLYNTDLKIASDYEMILRLFYKYKITAYYLPITTYYMQLGGTSNKNPVNIFTKSKEDYLAMKMHGISSPFFTLIRKNFRKLPQFLARGL